jgi:hypothetical protein
MTALHLILQCQSHEKLSWRTSLPIIKRSLANAFTERNRHIHQTIGGFEGSLADGEPFHNIQPSIEPPQPPFPLRHD